jgi:Mg-chelatase subunit ChlD
VDASATRSELRAARAWVDDLRADGGTNIMAHWSQAFSAESPAERLPIVVFLTDGHADERRDAPTASRDGGIAARAVRASSRSASATTSTRCCSTV